MPGSCVKRPELDKLGSVKEHALVFDFFDWMRLRSRATLQSAQKCDVILANVRK